MMLVFFSEAIGGEVVRADAGIVLFSAVFQVVLKSMHAVHNALVGFFYACFQLCFAHEAVFYRKGVCKPF